MSACHTVGPSSPAKGPSSPAAGGRVLRLMGPSSPSDGAEFSGGRLLRGAEFSGAEFSAGPTSPDTILCIMCIGLSTHPGTGVDGASGRGWKLADFLLKHV